jgi:glycosyltransferase involved in cell wall biosynthesis
MSLRILLLIDGLGPGGTERSLVELLPTLTRSDIEATVVCCHRREPSLEHLVRRVGVDLRFLRGGGLVTRALEVRRMIRALQPDLIHTALFHASMVGRLAALGSDAITLTSLVNTPYDRRRLENRDLSSRKVRLVQAVDGWVGRHATAHFHAVSEAVKSSAVQNLGLSPDRITVVERGRDSERLGQWTPERRQRARATFGLAERDEVIVNVGRQEHQKGQRYLLEAMDRVVRDRPNSVLLVAGHRGEHAALLDRLRRTSAAPDRIRLLDYREDVPDLLAAADVFAFPSLYEGMPGAVLEAMALHLPIVASRIPTIESVVEEGRNALLVGCADVAQLAGAIASLLSDRARAQAFGRRSREIFDARFTLERSASRMVELYRTLATTRRPRTRPAFNAGFQH